MNEYDELLTGSAPAQNNEFDRLIADDSRTQEAGLRASMQRAAATTPQRAAEVIKLSDRTKLPRAIVERNFDALSKQNPVDENDYSALIQSSPRLARWLTDEENAAVAHKDVGVLGRIENGILSFGNGWEKASQQGELADLLYKDMEEGLTPQETSRRDALKAMQQRFTELESRYSEGGYVSGQTAYSARQMGSSMFATLKGVAYGGVAGAALGTVLPGVGNVAGGTAGMIAGGLTTSADYSYRMEAAFAYDELRSMKDNDGVPLDPKIARNVARAVGAVNGIIEVGSEALLASLVPGFSAVIGPVAGDQAKRVVLQRVRDALASPTTRGAIMQAAGKMAAGASVEGLEEFVQNLVQAGGREIAQGVSGKDFAPDSLSADLQESSRQALDTFVGTFFTFAPLGGAHVYAQQRRIGQAKQSQAFFEALGSTVNESETFKAMPEKMQDFVHNATRNGPIENVYVPVEAWQQYWQSKNIDPAVAAGEALGDSASYTQALQSGEDIAIPISRYATKIAPTEANQFFAQELRLQPDAMNGREALALEEKLKAEQEKQKQADKQDEGKARTDAAVASVQEDVRKKLVAAGVEDATAQAYAATYGAAFRSIGERAGVDPAALYERYGLQINREGLTKEGETALGQTFTGFHGTHQENIDEFNRLVGPARRQGMETINEIGTWFAASPQDARKFGPNVLQRTLNMENPLVVENIDELVRKWKFAQKDQVVGAEAPKDAARGKGDPEKFRAYLKKLGYDGLVVKGGEFGSDYYVTLEPGQILNQSREAELPATIAVDGLDRPTSNSNGHPIAGTIESIESFWRWFGDSKVVDSQGRPLLVYHSGTFDAAENPIPEINGQGFHFGTKAAAEMRDSGKRVDDFIKSAEVDKDDETGRYHWSSEGVDSFDMNEEGFADEAAARSDMESFASDQNFDMADPMPVTAAYLRIVNPRTVGDQTGDWSTAVKNAKAEGQDGLKYVNRFEDKGSTSWVVLEPKQIKSATDNRGTFDAASDNILYQSKVERDLIIQHNVTQANLLHALKLGGFPVPSLAVAKAADSLVNFGEITLIGPVEMADPKGYARTRVYGSDVYSPRYPTIEYKFDRSGENVLAKIISKHVALTGLKYFDLDSLQKEGAKYLRQHPAVMAEFLESKGLKVERVQAPKEGHYTQEDRSNRATEFALQDAVRKDDAMREEFDAFAEALLQKMNPSERIFKGFTYSGNRSYTPHTLENVVRILKKDLRGGESSGNIYGIGQLRSKFSPQFRSLASIKDRRDLLVSKDKFEEIKKEIEGEFFALVDALKPYYGSSVDPFRFSDTVMAVIEDSPHGLDRAFTSYGFADVPQDVRQDIYQFVTRMRNMPTEYFEAKIMREVDLGEFKAAVVPDNVRPEVTQALLSRGVSIDTYKAGSESDRKAVVKALADRLGDKVMFQEGDAAKPVARIRWGQERQFSIDFLQGADLSSFLHESGHFWLEVLGDITQELRIVAGEKLNDRQRRMLSDYDTILKWLGVEDRSKIGVEQHEKFARGIEAYLMEGRAPSDELRTVFARFRAWMLSIYRSLRQLNVTLTPEVRNVMDRLYATDSEIEKAQNEANISPLFTDAKSAGMSEIEFNAYKDRLAKASQEAQEELQAKLMRVLTREREQWWKAEREKMRADVEKDVHQRPVYRALTVLQKGETPEGEEVAAPIKIDRRVVDELYGEGSWKSLPRGVTAATGGVHPNAAAEVFGFTSGDDLIKSLRGVQPMRAAIESETDQRMRDKHGDALVDGTIADAAREAVMNEDRSAVIQAELRALTKLRRASAPAVAAERQAQGQKRAEGVQAIERLVPTISQVREMAKRRIAAETVRNLKPMQFLHAARRASEAATKAAGEQNFTFAIAAKTRELLNVELYRIASKAVEEVDGTVNYMHKFAQGSTRARIAKAGQDYLAQIDGFLDRYEFARVPLKTLDQRKALETWIAEKEKAGEPVNLPPEVVREQRINYKDMTVEELRGVRDSVKHIEHLSKLKNRLLTAKRKQALDEVAAEIAESVEANSKGAREKKIETRLPTDEAGRIIDGWFGSHRKLANFIRQMDGWKDGGSLWEYVMRPINAAGDLEATMNSQAARKLKSLFEAYKGKEISALYNKTKIEALNISLTKMARLMVALNWGNADNRQKIMDGYHWTEGQAQAVLDTLDERDWKFVQGVWDYIDSYWHQIEAKEKRVSGVAPDKVAAQTVLTKFGELRGGYFPLKYDDRQAPQAHGQRVEEMAKDMMQGGYGRSTTRRGHTQARVEGVKLPVRLDFGVIFEHVAQVIHDLSHHEMLIDVNRILTNKTVQKSLLEHYGDVAYKQMQDNIRDIAAGNIPAIGSFEKSLNWVRSGATISGMGWNIFTSLLQPLGLSQSIVRIGPKWVGLGMTRWLRDAASMENTAKWIKEKSPLMRSRMETQMREINEIRQDVGVNTGRFAGWIDQALRTVTLDKLHKQAVVDSYFWLIYKGQQIADIPTWLGGYEKALAEGNDEERAIALADQGVLDSQGGGQMKDLAQIQRGGPLLKLWTAFYSYFNVTYNMTVESAGRNNFKNPIHLGRFAVDLLLIYTLPATLGFLTKQALTGPDDDDKFWEKLLRENLSAFFGAMVGLREIGSIIQGYGGYEGPAGTRFFSSIGKLIQQGQQGEADKAFWHALNDTAGVLLHYPAGQARRSADGLVALMEGETQNPLVLLYGPRKEK